MLFNIISFHSHLALYISDLIDLLHDLLSTVRTAEHLKTWPGVSGSGICW